MIMYNIDQEIDYNEMCLEILTGMLCVCMNVCIIACVYMRICTQNLLADTQIIPSAHFDC